MTEYNVTIDEQIVERMKSIPITGPTESTRSDNSWIETFTGRQFWPLDPDPNDVDIKDIAHALALKCRFTGHCLKFYSIAEHSVYASLLVPAHLAREALLHDAAEAYLADVAAPVKPELKGWKLIETRVELCIIYAFNLEPPPWPDVKDIDRRLVVTERMQNMSPSKRDWKTHHDVKPIDSLQIACWTPEYAERAFLARARELGLS